MSAEHKCPKCGAALSSDAPKGLCPRCLMAAALESVTGAKVKPTIRVEPSTDEDVSERIDRYKILQKLGEGGCGVVYMAEQTEPVRRKVALKVIKLGMDTKQVIARFEAERQALALMDHPNIAKVFDAGTTEKGRPYFVMELVKGIRITDYCDQNHLSTEDRLGLFTQVCQAIQHAHQKGIIHRDIKPSNILVTLHDGVPVPKVIDFGIAKATEQPLTEKTVFTAFGQFMGTPAYMSPEQAELSGLDIDTRSDIYALGVLLYELLTGKTPFDGKELLQAGLDEMRRRIREEEPMRPSTRLSTMADADLTEIAQQRHSEPAKLTRFIRGDLDWIVMKCLEKDRTRRYETANGLATDIRRHLDNEPVVACPPSAAYRFQKLIRRNKLGFAAVTAVAAALVIGLGIAAWQYIEKSKAYDRAVAAEKKAEAEAAKSRQVATFLQDMLKGVGPSVARGRDTAMLKEILMKTTERLGRDFTNQTAAELELRAVLADTFEQLGNYKEMEQVARDAVRLGKAHPEVGQRAVANAMCLLGVALCAQAKVDEAEQLVRAALTLQMSLKDSEKIDMATSLETLGDILLRKGKPFEVETEEAFRAALKIKRELLSPENPAIASSLNKLGQCLRNRSKLPEAEEVFREALAILNKSFGSEPHPEKTHALKLLAWVYYRQAKFDEAEATFDEALAMQRILYEPEHPVIAGTLNDSALVLERRDKHGDAELRLREALRIDQKRLGSDHPDVAMNHRNLSVVLSRQGKMEEAETLGREGLRIRRAQVPVNEGSLSGDLLALAGILIAREKYVEAEALAQEGLSLQQKLSPTSWHTFHAQAVLGASLLGQKRYAEAEPLLLSGCNGMEEAKTKNPATLTPALRKTLLRLVQLYEAAGPTNKAVEWGKKLAEFDAGAGGTNPK